MPYRGPPPPLNEDGTLAAIPEVPFKAPPKTPPLHMRMRGPPPPKALPLQLQDVAAVMPPPQEGQESMTAELCYCLLPALQLQDVCCSLCRSSMTAELRHCTLPPLEYLDFADGPPSFGQDVTTAMPLSREEVLHSVAQQEELLHLAEDKELDKGTILYLLRLALRGKSVPLLDDNGLWFEHCHMCDWVRVKSRLFWSSLDCPKKLGGCGRRDIVSIVTTNLPPDQAEVSRLRKLLIRDYRSHLPLLTHSLVGGAWDFEGHSPIIGALNLEIISSLPHRNPIFLNLVQKRTAVMSSLFPGVQVGAEPLPILTGSAGRSWLNRWRLQYKIVARVAERKSYSSGAQPMRANDAEHGDNSVSRILF